jgi:hypothetical protein
MCKLKQECQNSKSSSTCFSSPLAQREQALGQPNSCSLSLFSGVGFLLLFIWFWNFQGLVPLLPPNVLAQVLVI